MAKESTIINNLNAYIKDNKGIPRASRAADGIIFKKGNAAGPYFDRGKMYVMNYQTPDEEFYDQMPIVISMGWLDSTHAIGLNLHYIDYYNRVKLIEIFMNSFAQKIDQQIEKQYGNFAKQKQLGHFTYDKLSKLIVSQLHLTNAIHVYRIDRIKRIICLPYEEWHIGIIHNENYFFGGTIRDAQVQTMKDIENKGKKKTENTK